MKISDSDKGYKKVLQMLTKKDRPILKVGVFGEKGEEEYQGGQATTLDVATFHEFGLGVPERSFIRGWADENQKQAADFLENEFQKGVKAGATDDKQILERLGLFCQSGIQKRMADGIAPPSLVDGSTIRLIHTGQLRSSVSYAVVDKE